MLVTVTGWVEKHSCAALLSPQSFSGLINWGCPLSKAYGAGKQGSNQNEGEQFREWAVQLKGLKEKKIKTQTPVLAKG